MTPSKWILAIGAVIEAMLLGLLISNRQQVQPVHQAPEAIQSKAPVHNHQPVPEALEGASYGLPII